MIKKGSEIPSETYKSMSAFNITVPAEYCYASLRQVALPLHA